MKKVSGFQQIIKFFNSKKSNKIFTRAEYFQAMKRLRMKDSYKDTIRCYLLNAGYLRDIEPGVYRKLKKIPDGLTTNKLLDEAYPKSAERIRAKLRLSYSSVPYGVNPMSGKFKVSCSKSPKSLRTFGPRKWCCD